MQSDHIVLQTRAVDFWLDRGVGSSSAVGNLSLIKAGGALLSTAVAAQSVADCAGRVG